MGQSKKHAGLQFLLSHLLPFYFHILSTKTGSVTWGRTYSMLKTLNYLFDHLQCKHVPLKKIILYIPNEADELRCLVLCIHSISEIEIWDVSKNFPVLPCQQHRGMPADCFHNSVFCVIYRPLHLLFWLYSGFMFHLVQPSSQLVLPRMARLYLFCKYVPSAIAMLHTAIVARVCQSSALLQKITLKTQQTKKKGDELSVVSVPWSNPNHNL